MIEVKGVTKSFDDFTALDNVTCNIAEGCIYGMVGSNGAGKSTLLRVLSGIYKADKGEAIIDGINVYENTYMKNKLVNEETGSYNTCSFNKSQVYVL